MWDWGTWQPSGTDDPVRAIERGELHFDLYGEKLAGRFVLVRTGQPRPKDGAGGEQWLLIHKNDDHAERGWNPEDHPRSVKSGRTNDEVAAAPELMWRGDLPPDQAAISLVKAPQPMWDPPTADELAVLDALGAKGKWTVQGREVALTNLNKVLFPPRDGEPPVTKRDLIRYHAMIAPFMLPYLADRPINAHRYPDGVQRPGFWHKEVPDYAPDWLTRWHNTEADRDKTQCYAVIDSVAALVWMANHAAVELHPWTSGLPDVHQPTWALIDIDPGPATSFDDTAFAEDFARRWNRWAARFADGAPGKRLRAVGIVPLGDVGRAPRVLDELGALGLVGVTVPPGLRDGRNLDHASLEPFWAAVESSGLPVGVHGAPGMHVPVAGADRFDNYVQVHALSFPFDQMIALTALALGGVLERHPRLRVAFLESGVGWVPYFLERLDEHFEKRGKQVPGCRRPPSEYAARGQCVFSCEPEERGLADAAAALGADKIMYASDYPHWDSDFPDTVAPIRTRTDLSEAARATILGETAARFYRLG